MRLKSAYREKPVEQPSNIPEPSEKISVEVHDAVAPDVAAIEPPQSDEATLTLQKQIADLKKSEELQKQYALHVAAARAQPPTRQQKLEMWRQQGADEGDLQFLAENPQLVDMPDLCRAAAGEAEQQGFERGTPQHRAATLEAFHRLQGQQGQAQPAAADPAGFFRPRLGPSQEPSGPASFVSAPVSRTVPSGATGQRPARQVRLTAEEQEYARVAGISDVEYARQKQRLAQEKASGNYGERR